MAGLKLQKIYIFKKKIDGHFESIFKDNIYFRTYLIIPTGKLRLVSNSQVLVMGLNNSTAVIVSPF